MLTVMDKKNIKNRIMELDFKEAHRFDELKLRMKGYHNNSRDDLFFIETTHKISNDIMEKIGFEYKLKYIGFHYDSKLIYKFKYLFENLI